MSKPKIIIWDVECTPMINYTWNLYPSYISHDAVIQDWTLICGCWKELGEDKVHSIAIKDVGDDFEVVSTLRDTLASADVIIHHNGDKFDMKKLNTRLIYHNLPPLPKITTIDTVKEYRKVAAFSSNKLDYLSTYLTGSGKLHTEFSLWTRIMAGDKKAVKEMVEYNKVDVQKTEEIYERIVPYMKNPPHMGAMMGHDKNLSCKACGSTNVKLNGIRHSAAGVKKQEVQCRECYGYSLLLLQK